MVEKQEKNEAEKNEAEKNELQHCEVIHVVLMLIFVTYYISLKSA